MEQLEMQNKILNLGKLFVQELKLEPGCDTFSRWIAHYLAERITLAEQAEGMDKATIEKECFDIILKLWEHRHSLPSGRRPLQNFEPILETLIKLNPDKDKTYFFNSLRDEDLSEQEADNSNRKSMMEWVSTAKEIDKVARIWIEHALHQAAKNATNGKTKEWIDNAMSLPNSADSGIISMLIDNNPSFDIENYDKEDFSKKYAIEKLRKRIAQLQKFTELNKALLEAYENDLNKLL